MGIDLTYVIINIVGVSAIYILEVNMQNGMLSQREFDQKAYGYLGGRGLVTKILTEICTPSCDPLGPENPLILATGFFTGTILPTCNRLSVGAKSPLTGGIKEANTGGTLAKYLTEHAIKLIVIKNQPEENRWHLLYIDAHGKAKLEDAGQYKGFTNYQLVDALHKVYGKNISIASIGPAGERCALASSLQVTEFSTNNPSRAAARGGLGAVMGSKRIKAVVVEKAANPYRPSLSIEADAEFRELNKVIITAIRDNPLTGVTMPKYGTAAGVDVTGKMGALPYNNFSGRFYPEWEKLASICWHKTLTEQGGRGGIPCQPGCVVRCSNEFYDRNGKYLTAGIEYETVAMCGSNIGISDPNAIAALDRYCDDYGLDTIEIGSALGLMMDNGIMDFGEENAAIEMVRDIFEKENEWGPVLINGCAAVADRLGKPKRVPVAKRQAFAAYDPRVIRGYGLTFERSPMGADHTSGMAATYRKDLTPIQQADTGMAQACVCDCFMCLFPWSAVYFSPEARKAICRMAGILAGKSQGPGIELIDELGMEILEMEYAWNEKAGYTHEKDDHFYGGKDNFMYTEPAEATNQPFISAFYPPQVIGSSEDERR